MNAQPFLRVVGARPEDQRKLLLMAPVFFICGIAEMLNYNGFMTLFNQRFGSEYLPYVYTAEAIVLPLEAWLMSWLAAKLPKPKLMRVMYLLMFGIVAVNTLILLALQGFGLELRWYYPVLFIASSFVVRQQTLLLWSLAVDLCSTQQAKRLMPVFVGAATLGGVAAGLLAQLISRAFGPEVIYAAGGLLLLAAWPNYRKVIAIFLAPLSLKLAASGRDEEQQVPAAAVFRHALRSPFLLAVILLMTLMPALYFLMEYQFLNVTRMSYPDEQSFSRYFGLVTTILFILAFMLQLISGKLMARLGASQMLTAIAGVYVLMFVGAALFIESAAALAAVSGGYMLLYLLLYYTAEPSYQLYFKTLPLAQRDSYRYASQGIAASAGILLGAGLQFLHSGLGATWTGVAVAGLIGSLLLLVLAWYGRRLYMRELVQSVQRLGIHDLVGSIEEIGRNEAAMAEVREMLRDKKDSAKEVALLIMERLYNPKDIPVIAPLLDDPSPRIRVAAVRAMNLQTADLPMMAKVASFLEDPDDELRTEGVRAIAKMKHMEEQAFFFLRQKLLDKHPAVVAEAVKAMYGFNRTQSYEACSEVIERILDEGGEFAVYICRTIAELELHAFVPKVLRLVDEPHPAARVAAIACLGRLRHAAVVPKLVAMLPAMDEEMQRVTADSLRQMGEEAIAPLQASLAGAPAKAWSVAAAALASLLKEQEVRSGLAADAAGRLRALEKEAQYALALEKLGFPELASIASMRWNEVRGFTLRGVWAILSRLGDERAVETISAAVSDADEDIRDNAREVLAEGFGERRLAQAMVALLERDASAAAAALAGEEAAVRTVKAALDSSDPWWREIAAEALGAVNTGAMDAGADGRSYIETAAEREEELDMANEGLMMSRLNKVVFLRQVPYFADLSLEELGLIAGIAEERLIAEDEELLRRGEPNPAMYVVVEGNIELSSVSAAGWEATIGVLGSGDVCGVTSAMDGTPSTVTAQSLLGEARVLRLAGEDVSRLVRLYPEIGIGLLRASFARIRLLEEMMMRIDS